MRWGLPDVLTACLLLALTWVVYILAPVTEDADNRHALLVSEQLYREGNLQLDDYFPELHSRNKPGDAWIVEPSDYRLHWVNGHLYYFYPPGSSVLSVPFVPVFHHFGLSPVGMDGRPSLENERVLQRHLAALLTALFVVLTFALARDVLPLRWSVFVALAIALGTTALSTASRGLWSHTWAILLLSAAIWTSWRKMDKDCTPLVVVWVATLLSWCFLVRPTFALSAAGVGIFAAWVRVRYWWLLPLTGLAWLAVFGVYFQTSWGTWLPPYFLAGGLHGNRFGEALAGNLISPSRGLLIFTPGLLCWIYFIAVYFPSLSRRRWAALASGVVAAHWVVISTYLNWWGGFSFGPRFMTDVLPWLALLGILATRAWLDGQQSIRRRRVELVALFVLWGASAVIHSCGAWSFQTQAWNSRPASVDLQPHRVWHWTDPQFLRPFRSTIPIISGAFRVPSSGGTFSADVYEIPVGEGGTQTLTLDAGKTYAGRSYWVFGSVTGTIPGFTLVSRIGSVHIPLNPDIWTDYTIALANSATLLNTKSTLDASGQAQASINIPKTDAPSAIGLIFFHAYLVYEADSNDYYMASNPVPLRLK